ncbi:hypothetical protein WR25_20150 [Diploscapter pachys]|uniref:Membrane protein insertase YidC n=1 Tax=Diploscapter pachys TaxID=2018661 RepID=A0A2A2KLS0_9BILA|nr:hypothetical protein WR25_20150 [Diploscapter pachys]
MKRRLRALARELLPAGGIRGADHVLIGRDGGIERDHALLKAEFAKALGKIARGEDSPSRPRGPRKPKRWRDDGLKPPAGDAVWTASSPILAPGKPVTLTATNASGQRFAIELSVDDQYMFTVKQKVQNAGAAPVPVAPYGYVNRVGVSKDPGTWQIHTGPMSVHNGGADYGHYENDQGVTKLDKAIDWGWFEILEKPIFTYLDWLFRMVGNFGVAIILLTVTIRGLMFPIAQRQFASMAKMRALQPKMKALQERYKDDKPRMQQEVMGLYKTEKVNPVAGCVPTLIQIPIFYALYKVLMLTIEMRHQPFVAWIKDLSAPDPLTPVNLFGYLHFTPPHLIAIGVVPIILGISMYFQFKLNPAPMDDTQKQVFAVIPWVLMFVMASYPVGLQVYWIASNFLAILQQRILYARHPDLKIAAAK